MESLFTIGAALAVLTGVGTAIGQGIAAAKALEGISRNPEAAGAIRGTLILSLALIETPALYGLLVSILLIFIK